MGSKSCKATQDGKRTITIVVLGLDNAGKTTAKLALEKQTNDSVIPTIGFSESDIVHKNERIKLIDLGGAKNFRDAWRHYYADSYGFVYVLDSSEENRLNENQGVFRQLLQEEKVKGKPILILANKQDKSEAMDRNQILMDLDIEKLVNESKSLCRVELCTAKCSKRNPKKIQIDEAIRNGFDWLIQSISKNYDSLHQRVENDIRLREEAEKREKAERKARIEKLRQEREKEGKDTNEDDGESNSPAGFVPIGQAVKNAERNIKEKNDKFSIEEKKPVRLPVPTPRSSQKNHQQATEQTKDDDVKESEESPRRVESRASRFDDEDSINSNDEQPAVRSNLNKKKKLLGPVRQRSDGDNLPPPAPSSAASRREDFPLSKGPTVGTPRPSGAPVAQWAITTHIPQGSTEKLTTIASDNELDYDEDKPRTNRSKPRQSSSRQSNHENDNHSERNQPSSTQRSKASFIASDVDESQNNQQTSENRKGRVSSASRNVNGSTDRSTGSRANLDDD